MQRMQDYDFSTGCSVSEYGSEYPSGLGWASMAHLLTWLFCLFQLRFCSDSSDDRCTFLGFCKPKLLLVLIGHLVWPFLVKAGLIGRGKRSVTSQDEEGLTRRGYFYQILGRYHATASKCNEKWGSQGTSTCPNAANKTQSIYNLVLSHWHEASYHHKYGYPKPNVWESLSRGPVSPLRPDYCSSFKLSHIILAPL